MITNILLAFELEITGSCLKFEMERPDVAAGLIKPGRWLAEGAWMPKLDRLMAGMPRASCQRSYRKADDNELAGPAGVVHNWPQIR